VSWFVASDLGAFIAQSGLATVAPADGTLAGVRSAAIAEFEQRTGWLPALALDDPETVTFDSLFNPQFRYYFPECCFVEITAVQGAYVTYDEEDYVLHPQRPSSDSTYYHCIEFKEGAGQFSQLRITGTRGRWIDIPDDVNYGVQKRAAQLWVADNLGITAMGELQLEKKKKLGPREVEYAQSVSADAVGTVGGKVAAWDKAFNALCSRYRRVMG